MTHIILLLYCGPATCDLCIYRWPRKGADHALCLLFHVPLAAAGESWLRCRACLTAEERAKEHGR